MNEQLQRSGKGKMSPGWNKREKLWSGKRHTDVSFMQFVNTTFFDRRHIWEVTCATIYGGVSITHSALILTPCLNILICSDRQQQSVSFKHTLNYSMRFLLIQHHYVVMKNRVLDDYSSWQLVSFVVLTGQNHLCTESYRHCSSLLWCQARSQTSHSSFHFTFHSRYPDLIFSFGMVDMTTKGRTCVVTPLALCRCDL